MNIDKLKRLFCWHIWEPADTIHLIFKHNTYPRESVFEELNRDWELIICRKCGSLTTRRLKNEY